MSDFDLWLLALTWAPRFCCASNTKKQCAAEQLQGHTELAPHGLWPAYREADAETRRTYPEYCRRASQEQAAAAAYLASAGKRVQHEWAKHSAVRWIMGQHRGFQL